MLRGSVWRWSPLRAPAPLGTLHFYFDIAAFGILVPAQFAGPGNTAHFLIRACYMLRTHSILNLAAPRPGQ
jgi:hypothetical protein